MRQTMKLIFGLRNGLDAAMGKEFAFLAPVAPAITMRAFQAEFNLFRRAAGRMPVDAPRLRRRYRLSGRRGEHWMGANSV